MPQNSSNRIEVILDVYPNIFNDDPNYRYQYDNIQAVYEKDRETLEKCISEMRAANSPLLFPSDITLFSDIPEPRRVKGFLNLETKQFEFK